MIRRITVLSLSLLCASSSSVNAGPLIVVTLYQLAQVPAAVAVKMVAAATVATAGILGLAILGSTPKRAEAVKE